MKLYFKNFILFSRSGRGAPGKCTRSLYSSAEHRLGTSVLEELTCCVQHKNRQVHTYQYEWCCNLENHNQRSYCLGSLKFQVLHCMCFRGWWWFRARRYKTDFI